MCKGKHFITICVYSSDFCYSLAFGNHLGLGWLSPSSSLQGIVQVNLPSALASFVSWYRNRRSRCSRWRMAHWAFRSSEQSFQPSWILVAPQQSQASLPLRSTCSIFHVGHCSPEQWPLGSVAAPALREQWLCGSHRRCAASRYQTVSEPMSATTSSSPPYKAVLNAAPIGDCGSDKKKCVHTLVIELLWGAPRRAIF